MSEKTLFRFSDDVIVVIRELVQLSILTNTSVVDHLRAVRLTESENGYLLPAESYVNQYNNMIIKLNKQAEEQKEKMKKTIVDDE